MPGVPAPSSPVTPRPTMQAPPYEEAADAADPAVTKAVIPAAGLGTRFLPATKAQPKEMLPVVDKPAIQYVVEEAVRGRHRRHPHHHRPRQARRSRTTSTATSSSSTTCEEKGKVDELDEVQALAELADIHYVRQGEPLGLGHAVSVARKHVGDNPFVVHARRRHHGSALARCSTDMIAHLRAVRPVGRRPARSSRSRRSRPTAASKPETVTDRAGADPRHRREAAAGGGPVEPGRDGPLRLHAGDLRRARAGASRASAARSS